ncbi:hypothetical protein TIFTF001_016279 [Ficus carica]|uniref:Uncharacterized protein n=1 Tax=Ficus carica TaxID=3494 RepID=A0AA88A029_FICCA|nr:hypothetical protein TIFTF001_016279 [Ficus carica]
MKKSSSSSHDLLLGEVLREEMADDGDWLDSHSELADNDNLLRGKPSGSFVGTHVGDPNGLPSQLWLFIETPEIWDRIWRGRRNIRTGRPRRASMVAGRGAGSRTRALGRGGALSTRVGLGGGGAIWEMMEEGGTSDDGGGR